MHKTLKRVIAACAVLIVGGAAGYYGWSWWMVVRFHESTDDAYVAGEITPVSPKVAGYVRELSVTDNQRVKAGEVLLGIDDRVFVLAVAEAEARVAEAKAARANIDARLALQNAVIERATNEVAGAAAEFDRASKDFARAKELLKNNITTRRRYDDRSEEHTSELQSHSFTSYAVFCLKKKTLGISLKAHVYTPFTILHL